MANEFIIRKGYKSLASSEITGSLNVSTDVTSSDVSIDDWGSVSASLGSITSNVTDNKSNVDSLNAATSSYLLNTTDTLTGDLTVSNAVTASYFTGSFIGDFTGDTFILNGITYPTADGTDGQALITDGDGTLTFDDIKVYATVKNISGGTLTKGTPVHATSSALPPSGQVVEIIASSASVASTMPATFVLDEDLADEAEGRAISSGYIKGVDTSTFTVGEVVYVGENGGYTNVKPTGDSNLIQNLGVITRVDASNGAGFIYGSGRSNDVPNLPTGKVWVGSSNYSVTSSVVHLDEANGRLGLGNTAPTNELTVEGSISASGDLHINNNQGLVSKNVAGADRTLIELDSSNTLRIKGNDSEGSANAITMVAGGDVNFPADVTVQGTLTAQEFHTEYVSASILFSSGSTKFGDTSDDNHDFTGSVNVTGSIDLHQTVDSQGLIIHSSNTQPEITFKDDATGDTFSIGHNRAGNRMDIEINGTDAHTFTEGGLVGIGLISPTKKLHVDGHISGSDVFINDWGSISASLATITDSDLDGTGTTSYIPKWSDSDTLTDSIIYDSGTNIGIGTTSPFAKLQVNGDFAAEDNIYLTDAGTIRGRFELNSSDRDDVDIKAVSLGSNMKFFTVDTERMRIDASGNIGIGTTVATYPFSLENNTTGLISRIYNTNTNGQGLLIRAGATSSATRVLQLASTDDVKIMTVNSNGRVGIGTNNPGTKLEVYDGDIKLNDGTRNLLIGEEGGSSYQIKSSGYLIVDATSGIQFNKTTSGNVTVASGNVGIGVISPARELHISGSGNVYTRVSADAGSNAALELVETGGQIWTLVNEGSTNAFKLTNGGGTRLYIAEDGNVGIGTTSPSRKLTVGSTAALTGNMIALASTGSVGGYSQIGFGDEVDDNKGQIIYQPSSGKLQLQTGGGGVVSDRGLTLDSSENVGIGTSSPSAKLHVYSSGNGELEVQRASGALINLQAQASLGSIGTDSNHPLYLKTNAGTRLAITTAGNVGIGTTSPSEELHIASTSPGVRLQDSDGTDTFGRVHYSGASLYFYSRNNTSNGNFIWIGSNGTADTEFMRLDDAGSLLFGPNSAYQRVIFDSTPSTVLGNGTLTITPSTSPGSGTAQFYTRFLDRVGGGTTKHNVIIDGKLGVGTTAPTKELHVAGEISGSDVYINDWGSVSASLATIVGNDLDGSGTTSYVPKWSDSDTLTDSIIYDSGTKIGIGTTTPQQKLSINGGHFAVSSGGRVYIGGANGSDSVIGYLGNDSGVMELMTDGTRDFKIGGGTGGTTMFFDTSAGNVGIGTTSPDAKLHVAGDVTLGQKRIVSLPSFNMGASSVTDEYLVICKQAPSGGGVNASGIQGRIVFSRGSSGSYNNSHYIDINIQMSLDNGNVNNLDINQFEIVTDQTVNHAFTQIEEIDISGTKYVALKARTTGGGAVNHFYFEGSISDDGADTNILSRVRASDANITVTSPQPSGYPIAPYVVKNNNGQVGIGVTPSYKLDVTGDSSSGVVAVRNAANGRDTLRSENASGTRTFNIANDGSGHGIVLVRNSSGTTTNYIGGSGNSYFNGGNIGIGTTSPSYLFEVNTSSVSTYVAHFTRNGTSLGGMYVDSISNGEFYVKASGNNTTVLLNSSGNSYLNGGNVGIGTTTPNSKLEVAGRVDFLNDFRLRGTDSAANQGVTRFFVNSSNTLTIDTANDGNNLTAINSSGYLGIRTASPSVPLHVASDETGYAGTLATTVTSGSLLLKTHATDSTVTSFGGVSGGGGYVQRSNGTGTTSYDMLINPYGGNVGIGLDNPSVTLHVDGFARLNGGLQLNTANAQIYQIQNSDLRFGTNNLERVRISSGGNVGIGTTTMDGKLDVHAANGRWRINSYGGMYFRNDTNSTHENYIHPRSNGDLSIGRIATGSLTGTGVGTYADTAYDQIHINANGTIELPAYAAGYLRADANGVITSDSVPDSAVSASHAEYAEIAGNADTLDTKHATDFTLDYVTDNGSSTSNSITLGPSAVNGGRILAQNYNASNVLGVISSQYSSGNLLIGYGLEGNNGGSGYLSTYGNFSGRHGAIEVFSKGFKYVGDTSNSQTAIGTAVTVTEFFKVDEGNLTTSGTLTVSGASGTINGNTIIHAGNYTSYTDSKYLRSNADDSTSGKLGVGTTAVSKFHVYQNDATVDTGAGITIEQDGTGDAKLQFLLTSVQRWVTGIDNSDGDSFKIGRGSDWSLGEHLVIDTSGNTTLSNDLTIGGDVTINGSHLELINGNNAAPQSTDYLFIGGDNLASADGAIYLGNRGDGTGYGYRIYYSGVGSGNNNKLILKSENLGSNVDMLTFTADGAATFDNNVTVGGTFTELSAKRFKENIQPLESQVDNINKLNPVTFDWKKDNKSDVGFIAEEVKEIYPDLVSEENGEVIGIQYSKLTAVLVKALQDQQKQIDELKQEIFILKQK